MQGQLEIAVEQKRYVRRLWPVLHAVHCMTGEMLQLCQHPVTWQAPFSSPSCCLLLADAESPRHAVQITLCRHAARRWVNCLLIRELPFGLAMRLWDTYLAEGTRMKVSCPRRCDGAPACICCLRCHNIGSRLHRNFTTQLQQVGVLSGAMGKASCMPSQRLQAANLAVHRRSS